MQFYKPKHKMPPERRKYLRRQVYRNGVMTVIFTFLTTVLLLWNKAFAFFIGQAGVVG